MGIYINPPEGTKEQWLNKHAKLVPQLGYMSPKNGLILLCWADNGPFSCLAVITSQQDYQRFSTKDDPRTRLWFVAEIEEVKKVSDYA